MGRRARLNEETYWARCLLLPVAVPAVTLLLELAKTALVGPTSEQSIIGQIEFVIAASVFYALPIYAPMAFVAHSALRRWGTAWVPRWLILGPFVFAAIWMAALLLLFWVVGLLSPNPAEVSFTSDPPEWQGMLALVGIILGYAYALSALAYAGHCMIFGRGEI